MTEFLNELKRYAGNIEVVLNKFFDSRTSEPAEIRNDCVDIFEHVREFSFRGKMFRPVMAVIGYEGVGGTDSEAINQAASSLELLQSFFLIHDDIMDEDELRRGKPSVWNAYKSNSPAPANSRTYGYNMAMLAGDLSLAFASEPMLASSFSPELKMKALRLMNQVVITTIYGQVLDYTNEFKEGLSESDVLKVNEFKTSGYTFMAPLRIGATLGEASEAQLAGLHEFGFNVGLAFQLRDDYLGVFGDPERTGKPSGNDIREGKKTLLMLKALEMASDSDRAILEKNLGNRALTEEGVNEVRAILKSGGSVAYSDKRMRELVDKGKAALSPIEFKAESKKFLLDLAEYTISRDK